MSVRTFVVGIQDPEEAVRAKVAALEEYERVKVELEAALGDYKRVRESLEAVVVMLDRAGDRARRAAKIAAGEE